MDACWRVDERELRTRRVSQASTHRESCRPDSTLCSRLLAASDHPKSARSLCNSCLLRLLQGLRPLASLTTLSSNASDTALVCHTSLTTHTRLASDKADASLAHLIVVACVASLVILATATSLLSDVTAASYTSVTSHRVSYFAHQARIPYCAMPDTQYLASGMRLTSNVFDTSLASRTSDRRATSWVFLSLCSAGRAAARSRSGS